MDDTKRQSVVAIIQNALTKARDGNNYRYDDQLRELEKVAASHLESVQSVIDSFQSSMKERIEQTHRDIDALAADVKGILGEIHADMTKMRSEAKNLAKALTWYNIVLGFWLPLGFAVISVGFSLFQATADMKPLAFNLRTKCLPPWQVQCLYRDPPTRFERAKSFINGWLTPPPSKSH